MGSLAKELKGHNILALERFMDDTRHMVEFLVLTSDSPVGSPGEEMRMFLTDEGYAKARCSEQSGDIRIRRHAAIVEGHILYDRPKKLHSR
jgi:hypothetical protein